MIVRRIVAALTLLTGCLGQMCLPSAGLDGGEEQYVVDMPDIQIPDPIIPPIILTEPLPPLPPEPPLPPWPPPIPIPYPYHLTGED